MNFAFSRPARARQRNNNRPAAQLDPAFYYTRTPCVVYSKVLGSGFLAGGERNQRGAEIYRVVGRDVEVFLNVALGSC